MNIIETIVTSMTDFVVGSANAIGDGLTALLFVTDSTGITGLSNPGIVIFTVLGIGFAVGLMGVIFSLVRR